MVTPSGISITVIPGESVEITIDEFSINPAGALNEGLVSLGIYLTIEMNETDVEIDAVISMPYDVSSVEGLDENNLELRFYNEATGSWEAVSSWVDLASKKVNGNTDHFSTWTTTSPDQIDPPVITPGVPFEITPGSPVTVSANSSVELVTPNGISVSVIPSESVEITINEFSTNPAGAINEGLVSLGIYLTIEMNETDVDIAAVISMPYDASSVEGLDEHNLELRFYNETTGSWEAIPSWVDLVSKIVNGNTTHFSTWTTTSPDQGPPIDRPIAEPGVPFEVTPGSPVAVRAGSSVELVTPNGIFISVIPGESVEITINEFSTNPAGALNEGLMSLGVYLSIEMNETDVEITATLSLNFDPDTIGEINPSSLEFRFYNEGTGSWEAVPSWVDLDSKIVYGNTTHFSTWTITGSESLDEAIDDTTEELASQSTDDSASIYFLPILLGSFVITIFIRTSSKSRSLRRLSNY